MRESYELACTDRSRGDTQPRQMQIPRPVGVESHAIHRRWGQRPASACQGAGGRVPDRPLVGLADRVLARGAAGCAYFAAAHASVRYPPRHAPEPLPDEFPRAQGRPQLASPVGERPLGRSRDVRCQTRRCHHLPTSGSSCACPGMGRTGPRTERAWKQTATTRAATAQRRAPMSDVVAAVGWTPRRLSQYSFKILNSLKTLVF